MSRRDVSGSMRTGVVMVACAAWLGTSGLFAPGMAEAKVQTGQRAPGFSLVSLRGPKVALGAFAGQVVILDFWAQWCEPCKRELPELDKLQRELGKKVVVLTVNIDKQRDNADKLVRTLGLSLEVLLDPSGSVAASYDLPKMPTSYVIDQKGVVRFVHEGYESGDVARFKKEIDQLAK